MRAFQSVRIQRAYPARFFDELSRTRASSSMFSKVFLFPCLACAREADIATPSFFSMQGYLGPAPDEIEAVYAWTVLGGKSTGIRMIGIEGAWNFNHEDLLQNQGGSAGGTMTNSLSWRNHHTARWPGIWQ